MQRDLIQLVQNIKNKNFGTLVERQVETSIVIPLLESLGWDTIVEDEVKVQSGIGKGRSDIQLRIEGWCKVLLESKRGNADINNFDHEMQMMSYAGGVNNRDPADLAILTNGKDWNFYLPGIEGGYNRKRFYTIDISKEEPTDIASIFTELLARENILNEKSITYAMSMIGKEKKKDQTDIEVVTEIDDVSKIDKSGKYKEYLRAISPHLSWIKEQIKKEPDKIIRVKNKEMAKELGNDFINKSPTTIYWGLKYVLFREGIIVGTGTHSSGEKTLTMRFSGPGDKLPPSLAKYLENPEIGILKNIKQEDKLEKYDIKQEDKLEKYDIAISPHVNWIKEKIRSSKDGIIRIKVSYIAEKMGTEFVNKDPNLIFRNLNSILIKKNIAVVFVTEKGGEEMLEMRLTNVKSLKEEKKIGKYGKGDDVSGKAINSFFFDNEEYDVNSWREMLIRLIEVIYSRHKRKFDRILDIKGGQGKRYFSKRRILDDPIEIEGTGVYVEGKLGSNNIVRLCYDIINEFGYSDDDLKIEAD